MKIETILATLIAYAKLHLALDEEDALYKENLLLHHFGVEKPSEEEVDEARLASLEVPDEVIAPLRQYLRETKKFDENEAEREITWVMGLLSPLPSQVNERFEALYDVSPSLATSYLYDLSIKNNYVAKTHIAKNIVWTAQYEDGPDLEISINLSKPEKSNKDIAKLVSAHSTTYPKCMLCHENLGYWGNQKKPARENIRFIPLDLGGEKWYLQYSPYGYYNEHLICFYEKHEPMKISRHNMSKLFDFVDAFPHYFIGSNSDLPIVGGSILDHEHFQGGAHEMPLMKAPLRRHLLTLENVRVSILDFYNTVIVLDGEDREKILDIAEKLLDAWRVHRDQDRAIIPYDEKGQHSTITPIVRKQDGGYRMWLILRNNRCDETYPEGIFHAHPEYHLIKSEGIGLIEAAGLFILPPRLKRQEALVEEILSGKRSFEGTVKEYPDMERFLPMVEELRKTKKTPREYINEVCRGILRNVAVYKEDEESQKALDSFVLEALKR